MSYVFALRMGLSNDFLLTVLCVSIRISIADIVVLTRTLSCIFFQLAICLAIRSCGRAKHGFASDFFWCGFGFTLSN